MKKLISFLAVAGLVWSCGPGNETNNLPKPEDSSNPATQDTSTAMTTAADTGSLSGTWFLVPALASDTAAGRIPTIIFSEDGKSFMGNTGCNSMRGTLSSTDSTITISEQIMSTKMACPGYNEEGFLKSLPKANRYRFEKGVMILMMDATELSRWSRNPVKTIIKSA